MYVSQLFVYPVKSLAGFSIPQANLHFAGLQFDRQWMVVSKTGRMMTQRELPQMALINTSIEDEHLVLSTFGMTSHSVPTAPEQDERITTDVWGDGINAIPISTETDQWISQAIGEECRLVTFPHTEKRDCQPALSKKGDHTYFADAFPLLITSQASLDLLNEKLETPVGMNRFRPNIVVEGCDAHAEDKWKRITIGNISLRVVDLCARCSVPTVDPESGSINGPEPIHTLSSYRRKDGEIYFGVDATPDQEGQLNIGDTLTIKELDQAVSVQ